MRFSISPKELPPFRGWEANHKFEIENAPLISERHFLEVRSGLLMSRISLTSILKLRTERRCTSISLKLTVALWNDMPDRLTPQQRHDVKSLPGKPDIVLAKYRSCIFVNGCFWHGHKGCPKFVLPKTNEEFWLTKIENNRERDLRDYTFLESRGWRVIVVWECELAKAKIGITAAQIQKQLNINRESWMKEKADHRERREEWQMEMRRRKETQLKLLSEIP